MRFFGLALFGLSIFSSSAIAADTNAADAEALSAEISLAPLRVESRRRPRAVEPVRELSVGAGIGAEAREVPRNSLGVPLKNMERLEDVSLARRISPYILDGRAGVKRSAQAFARVGRTQEARARSWTAFAGGEAELELGGRRDRSESTYRDNRNTPHDIFDDGSAKFRRRQDDEFASLRYARGPWRLLGETDGDRRDVFAGHKRMGFKRTRQLEGNFGYASPDFALTGFSLARRGSFDSAQATNPSNSGRGLRYGGQATASAGVAGNFTAAIAEEKAKCSQTAVETREFRREEAELRWGAELPHARWLEGEAEATAALVRDHGLGASGSHISRRMWEAGMSLTSPRKHTLGAAGRARRFARVPRPTELFGDGAFLEANPALPVEEGWRAGGGPWLHFPGFLRLSVEGFAEEAKNAAVPVISSAIGARVRAVGGTWTRGWKASAQLERGEWSLDSEYTNQDARNAGQINWERGRPLPGRPANHVATTLAFTRERVETGLRHFYRSGVTSDIAGFRKRPTRHDLGAFVALTAPAWRVMLEGKNLLARAADDDFYIGKAGANVLEPVMEEREVALAMEILL